MSTDKPRNPDLREQVEDATQEMAESEENALAALRDASDTGETHTVTLTGGIEVEVVDSLPGPVERKAAKVERKRQTGDIDEAIDSMIDVMTNLIKTDGFDSKEVWREYFEEYGSTNLLKCAMAASEPYYQTQKEMEDQRQFRGDR